MSEMCCKKTSEETGCLMAAVLVVLAWCVFSSLAMSKKLDTIIKAIAPTRHGGEP